MNKRLTIVVVLAMLSGGWCHHRSAWAQGTRLAGPALRAVDELGLSEMSGEAYGLDALTGGRSLRQPGHHPVDELDRPRFTRRQCHRGWEVRTYHAVVTSAASAEQAEWLAAQIEDAWNEMSHLADGWSDVHRQPTFGLGAVSVFLTDEPPNDRAAGASGPRPLNDGVEWIAYLGDEPADMERQWLALRREAGRAFLRAAQWDQRLPAWVQTGLVGVAAQPSGWQVTPHPEPSPRAELAAAWLAEGQVSAVRRTADGAPPEFTRPESPGAPAAEAWMRYLLTAEDGRYAPGVLQAIASVVADSQGFSPEQVTGRADEAQRFGVWREQPLGDQPLVRVSAPQDVELNHLANATTIVLKMAHRWGTARGQAYLAVAPTTVSPRVMEFGRAGAQEVSPREPAVPAAIDLERVLAQMYSGTEFPWATVERDGRLLLWYDRERIAALWGSTDSSWQAETRDGKPGIVVTRNDGRRAWAEWNAGDTPVGTEQRRRPTVTVRWLE